MLDEKLKIVIDELITEAYKDGLSGKDINYKALWGQCAQQQNLQPSEKLKEVACKIGEMLEQAYLIGLSEYHQSIAQ
jgi:hypothetical protein